MSMFTYVLLLFSCPSYLTLCNPMDCSMPGLPVPHCLLKFSQAHVHCTGDIQLSHPLMPSFPPALNLSQHEGLFQWVNSSHQVAKVLKFQHQSFQMNIQGWFPLGLTGLISLLSKGLSRVFSSTTVWKHQFLGTQPSLWSNSHLYMTTRKTVTLTIRTCNCVVSF